MEHPLQLSALVSSGVPLVSFTEAQPELLHLPSLLATAFRSWSLVSWNLLLSWAAAKKIIEK